MLMLILDNDFSAGDTGQESGTCAANRFDEDAEDRRIFIAMCAPITQLHTIVFVTQVLFFKNNIKILLH